MAAAEHAKRFGSIFLAGIFLFSTVGLTAFVIWQTHEQDKKQEQLESALQTPDSSDPSTTQPTGENMLQGTQLANFTPITTPVTELQIIDTVPGTGEEVKAGATITAHYTGAVAATGVIFQSSHDSGQPVQFSLSQVIKGWTDGVPGMKVGGQRRLIIPADQAYGATPPSGSGIPANADLVFDIELVSIDG